MTNRPWSEGVGEGFVGGVGTGGGINGCAGVDAGIRLRGVGPRIGASTSAHRRGFTIGQGKGQDPSRWWHRWTHQPINCPPLAGFAVPRPRPPVASTVPIPGSAVVEVWRSTCAAALANASSSGEPIFAATPPTASPRPMLSVRVTAEVVIGGLGGMFTI